MTGKLCRDGECVVRMEDTEESLVMTRCERAKLIWLVLKTLHRPLYPILIHDTSRGARERAAAEVIERQYFEGGT